MSAFQNDLTIVLEQSGTISYIINVKLSLGFSQVWYLLRDENFYYEIQDWINLLAVSKIVMEKWIVADDGKINILFRQTKDVEGYLCIHMLIWKTFLSAEFFKLFGTKEKQ